MSMIHNSGINYLSDADHQESFRFEEDFLNDSIKSPSSNRRLPEEGSDKKAKESLSKGFNEFPLTNQGLRRKRVSSRGRGFGKKVGKVKPAWNKGTFDNLLKRSGDETVIAIQWLLMTRSDRGVYTVYDSLTLKPLILQFDVGMGCEILEFLDVNSPVTEKRLGRALSALNASLNGGAE